MLSFFSELINICPDFSGIDSEGISPRGKQREKKRVYFIMKCWSF